MLWVIVTINNYCNNVSLILVCGIGKSEQQKQPNNDDDDDYDDDNDSSNDDDDDG